MGDSSITRRFPRISNGNLGNTATDDVVKFVFASEHRPQDFLGFTSEDRCRFPSRMGFERLAIIIPFSVVIPFSLTISFPVVVVVGQFNKYFLSRWYVVIFYLLFRISTDTRTVTPLGYPFPNPSSASSWSRLSALLDSRSPQCLSFDVGCALQYMPNMNEPAVHPPVTFMQVFIVVQPFKWPVNIQVHGPVSVYTVMQQLHEFLQGYQNTQDLQKSKLIPSGYSHSDKFREQNPRGCYSGQKRIDLLGRYRIFRGLSPEPGPKCAWVAHLSDG